MKSESPHPITLFTSTPSPFTACKDSLVIITMGLRLPSDVRRYLVNYCKSITLWHLQCASSPCSRTKPLNG